MDLFTYLIAKFLNLERAEDNYNDSNEDAEGRHPESENSDEMYAAYSATKTFIYLPNQTRVP